MTIINSVIIGGGSGDEVEAYALGDAKNAVKDDKVTLNFSASILPVEESVAVSSSTEYFFTGYAKNTEAVFLSSNYAYIFKKNSDGVWSKTSTTSFGSQGVNKRCSPFGLLIDLYEDRGFKVTNGYLTSLDYSVAGRYYEPMLRALFSTTGEYCAVFSNVGSGYKTVVYYKNNLLQVLDEWSGAYNDSYPRFFFANKDGVEYLFVGTTVLERVKTPHTYRLTPDGAEYLGMFSVSKQNGDSFIIDAAASIGDLLITSSNAEIITLSSIGMFKMEVDPTQRTVVLKDASKEFTSFTSVLKDSLGFPAGDALNLVPTGDVNIIQYRSGCVKYNPSESTFEPYLPTGVMSDRVFYNADERVAVKIIDNTTRFNLYRLLQPIEQPYVATTFTDRSYCSSSGLTGIVKENNNGILKVSTVEDPNNTPPAIPDEYGLETTINYGSSEGVNGEVSGALTVSSDTSVSGFYGNAGAVVRAKNPFVDYSGTINSFEVVIPATMTASDSNYHMLGYFGENSSGNMGLLVYYSGRWILRLKFEGDSNYTDLNAGSSATLNTKTLVKVTYDSSTGYTLWLSTDDGVSWTNSGASTTTTRLINRAGDFVLGGETSSTDGWRGSIDFKGLYVKINNEEVYKGTTPVFGSVQVGYGYFRNTLTKPSDKYVPYDGGLLTEDNIGPVAGVKATTMNIVLGRSADGGSWTSDTEGYLSTQDAVVMGVNKKLSTPVYLWHDLSYITPAVPETIEAVVDLGANTVSLPVSWKTLDGVVYEYPNGFPETQASDLEANIVEGSNNLYATRTGDSCGLAISSTSPAGVDSSAVIGTVELDANGAITSYTPGE